MTEAITWSPATLQSAVSEFTTNTITHEGPFEPGTKQKIADVAIVLRNAEQTINWVFAELNSDGTLKNEICRMSRDYVPVDGCMTVSYDPDVSPACDDASGACGTDLGGIYVNMPSEDGQTVYYGLKTWTDDETEPSWSSAARFQASTKAAELPGGNLLWVAAAGTGVGGLLLYLLAR